MCKVYNPVGSLTTVKEHLRTHGIDEFKSIKGLIHFQHTYSALQQEIYARHRNIIEQERHSLTVEIPELRQAIDVKRSELDRLLKKKLGSLNDWVNEESNQPNLVRQLFRHVKILTYKSKAFIVKRSLEKEKSCSLHPLIKECETKAVRHDYINTRFEDAVRESGRQDLGELERKKKVVDELNNHIYGAIGEQKIVKELEKLSDEYILINDFTLEFHPSLYHKQNDDHIRFIQIDHILLSPAGIFLIETKNWSEHSLQNLNLHSPVKQIKRTNYALYRLINEHLSRFKIIKHHWGDRKIPIRNVIVLIKQKPIEEFQHVKTLTLNELTSYVTYFEACMSSLDVQVMADELRSIIKTVVRL